MRARDATDDKEVQCAHELPPGAIVNLMVLVGNADTALARVDRANSSQ